MATNLSNEAMKRLMLAKKFKQCSVQRFIASLHRFIASLLHRFIASSLHCFIASVAQLCYSDSISPSSYYSHHLLSSPPVSSSTVL
jgi:hypothetical protein